MRLRGDSVPGPRKIRECSRRDFIKTVGAGMAVLPIVGMGVGALEMTGCGSSGGPSPLPPGPQVVRWPISSQVFTTAQRQVCPVAVPATTPPISPADVAQYATQGYSAWKFGDPLPHVLRAELAPAYTGTPNVARLLFYFSMSDLHIADKEGFVRSCRGSTPSGVVSWRWPPGRKHRSQPRPGCAPVSE